jgi:DNA-binding NarL/FixJ family response regulator
MSKLNFSKRIKVVTVDDSPIITQRIKSILSEMENIELLGSASNAVAALNLIHRQTPNVVILDINLDEKSSQFNGIDLLISLRNRYPQMKIIMLTNLSAAQYRMRCIAFGANYFFDKSDEFYKLPEVLNEIATATNQSV